MGGLPGFLLGTEPARIAVGSGGGFRSLNIEYGRLRAYGRQLIRALHEVARRPLRRLRHRRDAVRLHQARRVDQQTLRTLARSAFAASLSPSADDSPAVEALLLDVPSVEETVDNAANRTLLYFLQALLSRVRLVRQELQREAERPDEATRTGLARRLPERMRYLNQLDSDLRRIARRAPFCHLSGAEISTAGLNAISASPCYGRAHRMAWWMLRHGIDASEAREQQWMIPTWEVFERWCFLVVMQQVASVLGVRVADWKTRIRYSKSGVGASVKATLCAAGYQTELCLQDTFPAWDVATAERASLSGLRCPDLTLSWSDPAGKHAWIVLDAKYRVSRPAVLDAMTSAHLYHDALRLHGERPVVSLLLTPAAPGAAWLATEEFIAQERVGVIDTSKPDTLARLLRAAIMGYDTTAW